MPDVFAVWPADGIWLYASITLADCELVMFDGVTVIVMLRVTVEPLVPVQVIIYVVVTGGLTF